MVEGEAESHEEEDEVGEDNNSIKNQVGHFRYECPDWEENANFPEYKEEE